MLFKVLTAVSWLTIYVQPSQQEITSKQAISSQSFIREDIPVSYKYTAIHDYTTVKPELQTKAPNPFHLESKRNAKEIQYAPLRNENPKYKLYTRTTVGTTKYTATTETTEAPIRKDHLEPKLNVQNLASFAHVPYIIPGHNIEILQSVNRSPGHNAFYRSYPQNIPRISNVHPNSQNQIKFQRAFKIYRMPEVQVITEVPKKRVVDLRVAAVNYYTDPHNKYYANNGGQEEIHNSAGENERPKLVAHPQTHKLLLNLARIYNNTKLPCKNSSHVDKQECAIPNHSVIFNHLAGDKTQLYPITQNRLPIHP